MTNFFLFSDSLGVRGWVLQKRDVVFTSGLLFKVQVKFLEAQKKSLEAQVKFLALRVNSFAHQVNSLAHQVNSLAHQVK